MPRSKQISEEMRQQSRQKLIRAGRKVFAEKGYYNTRISDLADYAEMSSGNFYLYFSNKEKLLREILHRGFDGLAETIESAASQKGSGRDKLIALIDALVELFKQEGEFQSILLSIIAHDGGQFMQELGFRMDQIGARYHRGLETIFQQAIAEGDLPEENTQFLAAFFFSFFNGMMITYQDLLDNIPRQVVRDAVLRMCGFNI